MEAVASSRFDLDAAVREFQGQVVPYGVSPDRLRECRSFSAQLRPMLAVPGTEDSVAPYSFLIFVIQKEREKSSPTLRTLMAAEFIGIRDEGMLDPPRPSYESDTPHNLRIRRGGQLHEEGPITTAKRARRYVAPALRALMEAVSVALGDEVLVTRFRQELMRDGVPKTAEPEPNEKEGQLSVEASSGEGDTDSELISTTPVGRRTQRVLKAAHRLWHGQADVDWDAKPGFDIGLKADIRDFLGSIDKALSPKARYVLRMSEPWLFGLLFLAGVSWAWLLRGLHPPMNETYSAAFDFLDQLFAPWPLTIGAFLGIGFVLFFVIPFVWGGTKFRFWALVVTGLILSWHNFAVMAAEVLERLR